MRSFVVGAAIGLLSYSAGAAAQTFSECNPLGKTCPPVPALGRSVEIDFTQGRSDDFKEVGSLTYDENGAGFTVANQGDAPLIQSNWYIMFGRVEFTTKAAPGKGIVSSAVLQSDDLDEIDWEWLGINDLYVQSNYFGKGNTDSFNRGATHDDKGNHDDFHTYTIDWSSEQIVWMIDGKAVRSLTPDDAESDQYPQSPMMIRIGVWAGGDPDNAEGTIQWSGGETDYSAGPYTMYLKNLKVTDYSTGDSYSYGDQSGSWESISAENGSVEGNDSSEPKSTVSAPAVTATVDSIPIPWEGTHRQTSSFVTPNVWPWVAKPTASASETSLPDWAYSGSGSARPPSASASMGLFTFALSGLSSEPSFLSGSNVRPGTTNLVLTTTTTTTTTSDCFGSTGIIIPTDILASTIAGSPTTSTLASSALAGSTMTGSTTDSTIGSTTGSTSSAIESTSSTSSTTPTSFTTDSTASPTPTSFTTSSVSMSSDSTSSTSQSMSESASSTNSVTGNSQSTATDMNHIAPTVGASSYTVTVSGLGVVCALLGNFLALF